MSEMKVDLASLKPRQFNVKQVRKALENLNSGHDVDVVTLVKMLNQMQYEMTEYEFLVYALLNRGTSMLELAKSHLHYLNSKCKAKHKKKK